MNMKSIALYWQEFQRVSHIGPIVDNRHYHEMVSLYDSLIDEIGDDEENPLNGLLYIVGELIGDYDDKLYPGEASGIDVLTLLLDQHGLKQSELSEIGSQGVVSEVLSGKRELNLRQIKALSKRFGVAPGTFIDSDK